MAAITRPIPRMTFNTLDFRPPVDGVDFWFEVSSNGTTWTNAAAEITTVVSALLNGAAVAIDSYDNQQVVLYVRCKARNSEALARGAAALTRQVRACDLNNGLGTLTFTHPDGLSKPIVWDVIVAEQALQFAGGTDDLLWAEHTMATWALTLTTHPFPRTNQRTDVALGTISGRSGTFTTPVYGTMPTEPSIVVASTGTPAPVPLGRQVLVYTAPPQSSGFTPPLSPYIATPSQWTADATALSGFHTTLDATANPDYVTTFPRTYYHVVLDPGTYQVFARIKKPSTATLEDLDGASIYVRQTQTQDFSIGDAYQPMGITIFDRNNPNDWQIAALDTIELPLSKPAPGSEPFQLQLDFTASIAGIQLDEIMLCNIDSGQVSIIDTAQGAVPVMRRVRISAATLGPEATETTLLPSYWGGWEQHPGVSGEFFAGKWVQAWDQHLLDPAKGNGQVMTYVVATQDGGLAPSGVDVSMSYFARFADFVAEPVGPTS